MITKRYGLLILGLLTSVFCSGQIIIAANTDFKATQGTTIATAVSFDNRSTKADFSTVNLTLNAPGTTPLFIKNSLATPLSINGLTIDSDVTFGIIGEWLVLNDLIFTKGKLAVDKSTIPGKLGYKGAADLVGSDTSYVNGRLFIFGSGQRTFPIGNGQGYYPTELTAIDPADATTPIGMEVIKTDPGFTTSASIKEIFTDHFWELTIGSGTFSGKSPLSLSATGATAFFTIDGDIVVLEREVGGKQNELGGISNNAFITSSLGVSTTGKTYALAKSDVVTVKVHKLITPDDDNVNDVLVIDGIDAFADNEVTLLDRWGVPFKTWKGFVNYTQPASSAQDVDFSKLGIGNYICIVKYTDKGTQKSIKQMISVLK